MDNVDWDLVAADVGLLTLASLSIFAGAFGSLPARGTKSPKSLLSADEDEDEDELEEIPERVSSNDAWIFPIIGSVALFGIYLIVKHFGKEWLNWFLAWYFSFIGALCVWKSAVSFSRLVVGSERWKKFDRVRVFILKGPREVSSLSLRTPTVLMLPVCLVPSILYISSGGHRKSILLTNILALALCHNALSMMKLDSFRTGCILLSGLFIYDIGWVFGTKVMVEVATSLDVPIKILWPKSLWFTSERGATMLGLGDIVIPGTFIALALRYDYVRSQNAKFTKPYFTVTLTSYVAGLVSTMVVMHVFGRAQPALLYLSPACVFSFLVTAFIRGEFRDAWGWSDDPEGTSPVGASTLDSAPPMSQGVDAPKGDTGGEDAEGETKPRKRRRGERHRDGRR